jgi:VIT1/CCC1 family predicted Fe2+/Mn2+ transporter
MRPTSAVIDDLLARLPDGPERRALQARARAYAGDCGCTTGGAFLVGAVPLALLYVLFTGNHSGVTIIAALVSVIIAGIVGKAFGLALASLKMAMLRWSVSRQLQTGKGDTHVHVH